MIRINQIKIKNDGIKKYTKNEILSLLKKQALKHLRISEDKLSNIEIIRHSIDARKKPDIFDIYMIDVSLKGISDDKVVKKLKDNNVSLVDPIKYKFPYSANKNVTERPVIIGTGPAGLFCGYVLAKNGYRPLLIERGADVDKRTELVENFWKTGNLNTNTNVQFGEGGAGTFSDGKLNTMVKDKDGRGRAALGIFVENGAPEDILYDAKPHIGTDILRNVVKNMREKIIEWGGEVKFESTVTDIIINDNSHITGVIVNDNDRNIISCSNVVLAIGHSARDTFYMLKEKNVDMKPKPFAVGFRVEHPQTLINLAQYGVEKPATLPPAPYKLTTTTKEGRGVYSFCMCPGGYVVNASSEEGRLAVNGMSYSKRDGKNANSAIIITVNPKDFGSEDVLSGVEFQRRLEKKAYELGGGKIPVEYYCDFKNGLGIEKNKDNNIDCDNNVPCIRGGYVFANVHEILPNDLNIAFVEGMEKFGKMIKGYNNDEVLVSGVESRTSSPVRINRNEMGESLNVKGLFPCGEGAGYAGGIMSAAMDGMKIAEYVAAVIS